MLWKKRLRKGCLGERFPQALFALIFSFCNCYIYMLERNEAWDSWDTALFAFNVLSVSAVVLLLLKRFFAPCSEAVRRALQRGQSTALSDRRYYFLTAAVIFLLWFPVFLAYYPGLFAYDVMYQIPQQIRSYYTHHPLMHTLYLQFFYYLIGERMAGSYNVGIAAATVVQMAAFSLMLSYSHLYLRQLGLDRRWRAGLIFLTGTLPVFSMLAISMTKDTLFSGFVAVLLTLLCRWETGGEEQKLKPGDAVLCIVAAAGMILFRNNGIYPILVLLPALLIKGLKRRRHLRICFCTAAGLLLALLLTAGLKIRLQAYEGSKNEMLSLPYQQLACAYADHGEEMTGDELAVIYALLPDVAEYSPHTSDPIKGTGRGAEDIASLVSLYITIGSRFPDSYIKGFFLQNAGYLGLTDVSFGRIYGTDDRQGIFLTDTKEGFGVTHVSLFPALESLYEKLYTANAYEYVPVLRLLCSPAFYFWLFVLAALYAAVHRVWRTLHLYLFVLLYILTDLAGPCVLPRYALGYIVCLAPLFFCTAKSLTKKPGIL